LRATAKEEKHEMTIDLIDLYHGIALDTLERLREQHAAERRKRDGLRWRKKMRGFKIAQDDDEIEIEDSDERPYGDPKTTLEDLERWEQEAQTWDLLRRLVHLRFPPPGSAENANKSLSRHKALHQYSTEREVWENFLEEDGVALERKTVLQWLKDTAEESGEDIDVLVQDLQQNAERGDIIAHGWLHTKAAIKNQKRIHVWPQALDPASPEVQKVHMNSSKTEPLITQLDPDAMTRQNRKLEAQDEYFERSIWLGCYEMLRRGRSAADIREWCMERTEVWRAVSMSGLPDEKPVDDDETGNPASSVLWRRMCFALARKGGGDEYERAVFGILSGDISSVEAVCRSWDDFVFVHYNALLRSQFDNYLQKLYPERAVAGQFGIFDAVQFHGDPKTAGERLIESLKTDRRTSAETFQPMKMLQGVLIANQFDKFIYQQGLALSKFANANGPSNLIPATKEQPENEDINRYIALDDHDSLRVLTHILLVFMSLGVDLGGAYRQTIIENVIVSYISFLRLAGKEELIPLYCSQLSGNRRYATLSRNLIDVTDPEQRITQIRLMRELGLDVQEFVKFQSRYLFADHPDNNDGYPATGNFKLLEDVPGPSGPGRKLRRDFFGDDADKVERVDMLFIRSLEWYLLVDGLWSETFVFGTMLYLRFFSE
jgi:nuclear pore complex protein Nup107